MVKGKKGLSVQCRQPFLKAFGAIFLIAAIALTQVPVPTVQAVSDDFQMDGNILIKYKGNSESVTIPNTVKEIATEAFAENKKLVSVTIPNSVTKIGNSAFLNCIALKSLKIPNSVKVIGNSAFSGCSALSSLSIGSGLSELEAGAFSGCTSLEFATMVKEETSVSQGSASLSASSIREDNNSFSCRDGVIYGKNETKICQMLAGRKSDSYTMPSTVTSIDEYAFWGCENLKKVSLSNNLKEISAYAFSNCTGLEKVEVPYSVKSIQMKAFADCKKLSSIEIPKSVSFVHETAFDGCPLLQKDEKSGSVSADSVSADSVSEDAGVTNSVSQDSVSENGVDNTKKQEQSKESSTSAKQIDGMETKEDASVIGKTKIVGGQAVVLINAKQANIISDGVSSNSIQNQINTISEDGTKVLREAYYKNSEIKKYDFPEGIQEIEDFAFARTGLSSINIPDTVSKIGYAAFYHCNELSEVTIPESVTQIKGEAFQKTAWMNQWIADDNAEDYLVVGDGILIAYKGKQDKATIPETVKIIATDAFKNHTEITNIIFPESLTTICDSAFTGCENLKSFTGGDKLTTIEEHAFDGCPIVVTSGNVVTEAKNYIGTVGDYQVLLKEKEKNQVFNGIKWIGILISVVSGLTLFTIAGINRYKKRV